MNEPILTHRDGAVQVLSFNNPAARNALTAEAYLEAQYMAESLGDDEAAEGIGAFFDKRPADFIALRRTPAEHS
jgi:hypothetical protein